MVLLYCDFIAYKGWIDIEYNNSRKTIVLYRWNHWRLFIIDGTTNWLTLSVCSQELEKNYTLMSLTIINGMTNVLTLS